MRPDENDDRRLGTPLIPQRAYVHTPPSSSRRDPNAQQTAAANIVRGQINALYDTTAPQSQAPANTAVQQPEQQQPAPQQASSITQQTEPTQATAYQQTQTNPAQIQPDQWKQYHSAWQDYYQKYYERYYVGQVQRAQQSIQARVAQASQQQPAGALTTATATASHADNPDSMSRDEAMYDLRSKLRDQIQTSAIKVRKSRHFIPITAAVCVMMVFLFLQYNRVLFANVEAYISPGNINPANVIVDPTSELAIGDEPKLIIPKINVDVPVDYNAKPDHDSQMAAMSHGLAYFGIPGANSKPGQIGNTVISGHSSNDIIDQGQYKFIFARLDVLKTGDTIYANYEGKRYVYVVTKKEVVKPSQVSKLVYKTDKPVMTLITCTPLGTAINRLLVTAEQISPNPKESAAKPAPVDDSSDAEAVMPGNSPTFLQRVFGGGN
ncbi:MAG: sortase [Candidatus Saccharimonadales bacterium]